MLLIVMMVILPLFVLTQSLNVPSGMKPAATIRQLCLSMTLLQVVLFVWVFSHNLDRFGGWEGVINQLTLEDLQMFWFPDKFLRPAGAVAVFTAGLFAMWAVGLACMYFSKRQERLRPSLR